MSLFSKTRLLQLGVVAAVVVAISTADAQAFGRHKHGGYGGSYGSYGGYGGSYGGSYASYGASYGSYGGSYGSYGGSGSHGGGLFARWHARKAARKSGSYGSNGSYGSYGSYGGSYVASYGGSYGSYGGYGSNGSYGGTSYYGGGYYDDGVIYDSAPATEMSPVDGAGPPPTPSPELNPEGAAIPPQEPSASATEAAIFVSLPEDAKVFVNDRPTTSVGAERHYISRGLDRGRSYSYQLRVEFQRDGQPVVEDKLVRLQAGQAVKLAFGSEQPAQQTAATELKLHVPANAKVTLAGAPTQQTGEVRTYASTMLKPGQKWDGYVVRVELEQAGKTLVEERALDIEGGKSYDLAFEMKGETTQVAAK
jgi:uncharacterized protein (TIGR03000 family)